MSGVLVLTPVVISAWPALAASVTAAVTAAGFEVAAEAPRARAARRRVALDVEDVELGPRDCGSGLTAGAAAAERPIVVERQGVRVAFSRGPGGALSACVEGELPEAELRALGEDLARRVIQQHVHRRLRQALSEQGFVTVDEERCADGAIHLHVRRWQG